MLHLVTKLNRYKYKNVKSYHMMTYIDTLTLLAPQPLSTTKHAQFQLLVQTSPTIYMIFIPIMKEAYVLFRALVQTTSRVMPTFLFKSSLLDLFLTATWPQPEVRMVINLVYIRQRECLIRTAWQILVAELFLQVPKITSGE